MTTSKPTGLFGGTIQFARRASVGVMAVSLALTLTACGRGGGTSPVAAEPAVPSPAGASSGAGAATPAATADASTSGGALSMANPFPTPSAYPSGSDAQSGMPAITANATAVDKEPTVAKGTGPAPTNLMIRDIVVGTGKTVVPSDSVNVRYLGALYDDGTVFDASWKSGSAPVPFPLSGVVPGFAGGIVGMKIGGRREIVIPSFLGYGPEGGGPIPPNATLVFVVDLVSIGQ